MKLQLDLQELTLLVDLLRRYPPIDQTKKPRFLVKLGPVTNKEGPEMTLTLNNTQKCGVQLTIDPPGSRIDGVPTWQSTNPAAFTIEEISGDGLSAKIYTVDGYVQEGGELPECVITGDADLGQGVIPIEARFFVEVTAPQASGFGVSFGEPEPK